MVYDVTIIGGGIVGLATACKVLEQQPGLKVAVLEKESAIATHQTDRNSGVIHSGIYYKPGSAKAVNCVKGHKMLLAFCREEKIPFELCGKVIVAVDESEFKTLDSIYQRGIENGLEGIKILEGGEVKKIEPHCAALRGIWVPQAGIIDFTTVAFHLAKRIKSYGGDIITSFQVKRILIENDMLRIDSGNQNIQTRLAVG
nr:FAD-dependent oxidoreductase [Bacteroidota bacterium]